MCSFFRKVETVSSLLEGKHEQRRILTRSDCTYLQRTSREHQGRSELESGMIFRLPTWNQGLPADSPSSSGLPMSPGGGGCQLALIGRRAILRSSPGNLYLIMQLHTPLPSFSTQYIRLFGVVVSILQQSKPMPGIHGRLTCFKQRLMKDVMPLVVRCACSYMLNLIIVQGALSQMNRKGGMIILLYVCFSLQLRLYIRELLPEQLNPYCPHYGNASVTL